MVNGNNEIKNKAHLIYLQPLQALVYEIKLIYLTINLLGAPPTIKQRRDILASISLHNINFSNLSARKAYILRYQYGKSVVPKKSIYHSVSELQESVKLKVFPDFWCFLWKGKQLKWLKCNLDFFSQNNVVIF